MSEIFTISKAGIEDLMDVFDLANDPVVRESSFIQEKILLENHRKWFLQSINDPECFFYVLRERENSEFIGSLRFNKIEDQSLLISIQIVKKYRGIGIAKSAIMSCINVIPKQNHKLLAITAHIKKSNTLSQKAFLKLGFEHIGSSVKNDVEYDILKKFL